MAWKFTLKLKVDDTVVTRIKYNPNPKADKTVTLIPIFSDNTFKLSASNFSADKFSN